MTEGHLRPAQRLARQNRGESLDASEAAAALLAEIGAARLAEIGAARLAETEPEAANADYVSQAVIRGRPLPAFDPDGTRQAGYPSEAPEDILFGPLAVARTPEERHLAAWELFTELQELRTRQIAETDLPARLLELHSDNGHGWCEGCGRHPDNGAWAVRIDACLTWIEMDR